MSFTDTHLWKETLGSRKQDHRLQRDTLKSEYLTFRTNAEIIAKEIEADLPSLTVHDMTHIDALWNTATLICGYDFNPKKPQVEINPAEAFVLGGAFIIHDLGNTLSAYPERFAVVRGKQWEDILTFGYMEKLHRRPTAAELKEPEKKIRSIALMSRLRQLHAQHSLYLATIPLKSPPDYVEEQFFLLHDQELRRSYGEFIGQVAASHGWNLNKVSQEFKRAVPKTTECPWPVDLLKLACVIRLADASQIDKTRAPWSRMKIRDLDEEELKHWTFQEKLLGPELEGDRLYYRSRSSFTYEERDAWWTCCDTLKMINKECRAVDALLADLRLPFRFAAKGVLHADDPVRLANECIMVDGWCPIDVKIHVGNAKDVVGRLGGHQLYGDDPFIALRELIANGADAVRARRFVDSSVGAENVEFGKITVTLLETNGDVFLEVEDNGVGMSQQTLIGPLLDFGASYWQSETVMRDYPGLLSSRFEPTGKFGIGFFSVFMLGKDVKVISRHFQSASDEIHVLVFDETRPILRLARPEIEEERLLDASTRIRVKLDISLSDFREKLFNSLPQHLKDRVGFFTSAYLEEEFNEFVVQSLIEKEMRIKMNVDAAAPAATVPVKEECVAELDDTEGNAKGFVDDVRDQWASHKPEHELLALLQFVLRCHCLTLDVEISVATRFGSTLVASADDWKRLSDNEFAVRLEGRRPGDNTDLHFAGRASFVGDEANPVGRLFPRLEEPANATGGRWFGSVCAGGLRSSRSKSFFYGVLLGKPSEVSRHTSVPVASAEDIADWFERNEEHLRTSSHEGNSRLAALMVRLGKSPQHINPFFRINHQRDPLLDEFSDVVRIALCVPPFRFVPRGGVIYAPYGRVKFLELPDGTDWLDSLLEPVDMDLGGPVAELALHRLSERWNVSLDETLNHIERPSKWEMVGTFQEHYDSSPHLPFYSKVIIAHRPGTSEYAERGAIDRIDPPSEEKVHPKYRDGLERWVSPFFYSTNSYSGD